MEKVADKGTGSFAKESIEQGEVVASFGGFVVQRKELRKFSKDRVSRSIQINNDIYLLSGSNPEPGDMLNHSCYPNCGATGISTIVAIRQINIGEELTFDYAMTDSSTYDEFDCICSSPGCRKKITGNDWMIKELHIKYKNNFTDYINKLI